MQPDSKLWNEAFFCNLVHGCKLKALKVDISIAH